MRVPTHGISDALFSKTQQRVMGVLFANADRSFYTNEILRLVGAGSGVVQRELKRMTDAGLLTMRQVGNQKHYRANKDAPVFEELRGIVIKTFGIADQLRQALLPLVSKVSVAFIYGSFASGADNARSDIDLMLISEQISYPDVISAILPFEAKIARPINPTIYSLAEWRQRLAKGSGFAKRVQEKPKVFLIGSENDLKQS